MGIFKRKKVEEENPYLGLRQQILDMKLSDDLRSMTNGHPVYGAVVDIDRGNAIATLACAVDGTTSLYFSTGGAQMGIGQADEEVRKATIAFLYSSDQILDKLEVAEDYSLPKDNKHIVYLLTEDKIYKKEYNMGEIGSASKEMKFLNFLYQNVLLQIGKYNKIVP